MSYNTPSQIAKLWPTTPVPPGVRAANFVSPGGHMSAYMNGACPMWPGFRTAKITKEKCDLGKYGIEQLEAGFYWRVERNYADAPAPKIVTFRTAETLDQLRDRVLREAGDAPRVVLHACPAAYSEERCEAQAEMVRLWSLDSVGQTVLKPTPGAWSRLKYASLPSLSTLGQGSSGFNSNNSNNKGKKQDGVLSNKDTLSASAVRNGVRACRNIFGPLGGNRTCFGKCR